MCSKRESWFHQQQDTWIYKQCWLRKIRKTKIKNNTLSPVISCPARGNTHTYIFIYIYIYTKRSDHSPIYIRYAQYLRYDRLIGGCCTTSPRPKSARGIISLSVTLAQISRGILRLSSIASIYLLFIIFSRKIAEYAHIWLRLLNS